MQAVRLPAYRTAGGSVRRLDMRWYRMPVEDLPESDYRARAERFHQVAQHLSDPVIAERFEAMATDAIAIAEEKAVELH
jgi:hypothetical protein